MERGFVWTSVKGPLVLSSRFQMRLLLSPTISLSLIWSAELSVPSGVQFLLDQWRIGGDLSGVPFLVPAVR